MSSSFPARSLAFVAAVAFAGAEVSLTTRAGVESFIALPLAMATGASMIWAGLAIDALVRRRVRPDRSDIQAVIALQKENQAAIADQAGRLARAEDVLAFVRVDFSLSEAEHAVIDAARAVETWEGLALTLPRWIAARDRWAAIAGSLAPNAVKDLNRIDDVETRAARERLPITQNFSSQDLKAAATYLVYADHWMAACKALMAYRQDVFDRVD